MASPDKKAFLLRIDPVLWVELERVAAAELRSVNAQVEYLLRESLRQRSARSAPRGKGAEGPTGRDPSPRPG